MGLFLRFSGLPQRCTNSPTLEHFPCRENYNPLRFDSSPPVPICGGEGKIKSVKRNPFPWFPWWPPVDENHYLPILVLGILIALAVGYLVL